MASKLETIVLNNPPEEDVKNGGISEVLQLSIGFDLNMPIIADQERNQGGFPEGEVMRGELRE